MQRQHRSVNGSYNLLGLKNCRSWRCRGNKLEKEVGVRKRDASSSSIGTLGFLDMTHLGYDHRNTFISNAEAVTREKGFKGAGRPGC